MAVASGPNRRRASDDGGLRRFVNVYVAGEDIRFLEGLATPVEDGAEVTILPAVAGGFGIPVFLEEPLKDVFLDGGITPNRLPGLTQVLAMPR